MSVEAQIPWVMINKGETSIRVRSWVFRQGATMAAVFELPRGEGPRVMFTGCELRRVAAHAAQCYALVCCRIADLAESSMAVKALDARPVSVAGGSLEINGADALSIVALYFGEPSELAIPRLITVRTSAEQEDERE